VHPDDIGFVRHEFARSLEQLGTPLQVQFRYRRADGCWRTLLAIARNLLNDPVVRGIVVNSRDITEQRELELQLQHSQKLDAIGRMAGAVAHDFNNLLTVIQGNAGLALSELAATQPGREELEEIEAAAERASALTRQLLTFSRQQSLELQELPVNGVIQGMQRLLARAVAADQGLQLALGPEAGAVRVDRGQLEQVLMNLVVNARDAMPGGGTVTLSTRNEELRPEVARFHPNVAPGAFVVIAVADTGVGMSAEVKSRIFEPFFTTKEPGKGTGLGLPTVYGIVQQSGGFVAVHSAPGQGSTFEIFLPRV
jgi:two-component system, cell cycle sensor histidine kinase and response regulator CckA